MLNILRDLEQNEAQILLSSTALSLLPDPGIGEPRLIDAGLVPKQQELLKQIKKSLKIEPDEVTDESLRKVYEFLAEEITNQVLDREKEKAARKRLGERGSLRPDLYQVEFSQQFKNHSEKQGIRRTHVIELLQAPDSFQHLLPPEDHENQNQLFSIYSKTFSIPDSSDPYTMVVMAKRDGYILSVYFAWRIYHSDVDLSDVETPLGALECFAEIFGIPFSSGGPDQSRFLSYQKIKIPAGQFGKDMITFESQKDKRQEAHFLFKKTISNEIEVAFAFVIDVTKYESSLVEHGVKLR